VLNRVGGSARYSQHPCRVYHLHEGKDYDGDEGDQQEGEHHLKFVVHDTPMTLWAAQRSSHSQFTRTCCVMLAEPPSPQCRRSKLRIRTRSFYYLGLALLGRRTTCNPAILSPKSPRKNGPVTFAQATYRHSPERNMPMLVLVMVFNILVALALVFVFGRIYQIRRDELARRVEPPPVAYVPPTG
jgi:hypothetical protein